MAKNSKPATAGSPVADNVSLSATVAAKKAKPAAAKREIKPLVFKNGAPPPIRRGGGASKYGLEKMQQGQYFDIDKRSLNTVLSWAKRHGRKFVSRTTESTPVGMVSVYWE